MNSFTLSLNKFISKTDDYSVKYSDITHRELDKYIPKYNGMYITDNYYIIGPLINKVHDKIIHQNKYALKYKITDCLLPVK